MSKLWVHVVAWNYDGGGGCWWTTVAAEAEKAYHETMGFFDSEGVAFLCMSLPDIAQQITDKVDDNLWLDPNLVAMPALQIERELFV